MEEKNLEDLKRKKEDIKLLLLFLEDVYREGIISDRSYEELKEKNTERLEKINKKIR
jgi:ElaB/YqjD/DUF883 family membrane-anchored ribosome-binding protein